MFSLTLNKIQAFFSKRKLHSAAQHKIGELEKIIGNPITNPHFYLRALRHRSKLIEDGLDDVESYEQLEFLGDAVLDLVVTEILFELYPDNNEGFMTKVRSRLVREDMLADLSRKLGFPALVEVGSRVRGQGIELKNSVLCDIFEAVVGAIYKDLGFAASQKFIKNVYHTHIDISDVSSRQDNYKSLLLEFAQAKKLAVPEYQIISETGPDHDKTFEVNVVINNTPYGWGKAKNKKKAEQAAAKRALEQLEHS
ncbi:MAG: ribonuclease III [Candidatus Cyclonatronum sp.]|uniref:ribonuclease III n=1 Tax=Cyclonatronum sp. TaxID=3024185 RepID=UPI0025C49049|nr:ribonuclease III [Cyclonatronum sp.]MCC5933699.1 ribonuclease III [Balneolales bacterium]MCH8486869.1 ribonuclease III [Cyclonatronum sp.]